MPKYSTDPIVILLVEDSPTARFHARTCLESGLGCEYTLFEAACLETAVELLSKHAVSLVLLDLNLPDSGGLDTFRSVQKVSRDAAIVIISGDSDERTAVSAVRLGAQDYIVKGPSFTAEVLGRTVHFALERTARHLIEKELTSIRNELQFAEAIQQRLYPHIDSEFPNVSVAGRCMSATQNCGDYFDYIPRPDGSLLVVIGDVSGHGIGPAMIMVETRAFLRALAASEMELGKIVTLVNRLLSGDMQQQLFVTLFVASFDATGTRLCFSSAGHPGYLVKQDGKVILLESDSPPLGITYTEEFEMIDVNVYESGDLLALFTDGITEATCDHEEFLGDKRVLQEIVARRKHSSAEILDSLFELAAQFDGDVIQQDDRTAVIVKTNKCAIPSPHFEFPANSRSNDASQ